jgi:hypothetical protein
MIYSTVKKVCDAGVCDEGRRDSYAGLERDGLKDTDRISAVWCLDNCGVPGTLWALKYVDRRSEAEAFQALWKFILAVVKRSSGRYGVHIGQLEFLAQGHRFNLDRTREHLRLETMEEHYRPMRRAQALMVYRALDQKEDLNVRAVEVFQQAMEIASCSEGHAVASQDRWKAEYQWMFQTLRAILSGEQHEREEG